MNILLWIVLGAIAGWIAEVLMKSSHGLGVNIVLGIIGAFVGGLLMSLIGQEGVTGFDIYSILVAVLGAVVLIAVGRMLSK